MTDNTAIATTNKHPIVVLRERLESRRSELANALPPDVPVERFIRALITSAQINPDIQACSWQSLWLACLKACRDGLLPDGREGAIVPFKSTATWIPMYQGQLKRFRQSGQFKWITAGIVREGETFHHFIDEFGEHFYHKPGDNFDAPMTNVYAMASTKDGALFVAVMSKAEADKHRNMSRATREDAPWKMWPEEMYKKTALHRLSKLLPMGSDIDGDQPDMSDAPQLAAVPTQPRPATPADALEQFASEPAQEQAAEGTPS